MLFASTCDRDWTNFPVRPAFLPWIYRVVGYLGGGMDRAAHRPDLIETTERLAPGELAEQLASSDPPLVLDVRSEAEAAVGRLRTSRLLPLGRFLAGVRELPRDRRIVVHCESGFRSAIACSILQRNGHEGVGALLGGIDAWTAEGLETVS